jgi:hypothetical protein
MISKHLFTIRPESIFSRFLSFGTQIGNLQNHVQRGSRIRFVKPPGHSNSTHHYIYQEEK